MAPATKEVEALGKRRQELVDEGRRLRQEGERLRERNQGTGSIGARLRQIDAELTGVNLDYKASRREAGALAARKVIAGGELQGLLQAAYGPMIHLADYIDARRGEGAALPALGPASSEIAREGRGYLDAVARLAGATEED
jgi:hypothetical protein